MVIIDRVNGTVLDVPAKSRETHPDVEPRDGDTADAFFTINAVLQQRMLGLVKVVKIEKTLSIVKYALFLSSALVTGEGAAEFVGGQVCRVLHNGLVLLGVFSFLLLGASSHNGPILVL